MKFRTDEFLAEEEQRRAAEEENPESQRFWYCGIRAKGVKKVYSYISDEGELECGSYVLVPFGAANAEQFGEVVSCGEYSENSVPYPIEKTKHIIRVAAAEEYEAAEKVSYKRNYEIEEADDCIKHELWTEVYYWACDHHDSNDENILRKVIECYELCAEEGMPEAALNLGTFYYTGRVVEQDYKKAYSLYKIAADAGELRAICNCGYCFYYGRHTEVDYAEAYRYFLLGALLHNDPNCLYKLGDMYREGKGVEKNENYAFMLFSRALEACEAPRGDSYCLADAKFRVGECLLKGIGTDVEVEEAHELLCEALAGFYRRRKSDPFISGLIESAKELIAEAEEILDSEI